MQTQRQFRVLAADEPQQDTTQTAPEADVQTHGGASPSTANGKVNIALAMLPFTALPFSGNTAIYAWGRLVLYGGLAVMLHSKHKTASYTFAGAAGLSLLTSLANGGQK